MSESNPNSRLEAYCDGVFAIALTLLVIEIKAPVSENIHTANDLWQALLHLMPTLRAFLISFGIILINWVNHHATLKMVNKASPSFIYANGFLLLTIAFMPFPTALLGEYGLTAAAVPAVVIYSFVNLLQSIAWCLLTWTMIRTNRLLTESDEETHMVRRIHRVSYFALLLYSICIGLAFWLPQFVAITINISWIVWLFMGLKIQKKSAL